MRWLALLIILGGCSSLMPSVEYADRHQMKVLACGAENAGTCGDVVAVYDPKTQTMHWPEGWEEWDDYRQSTLIHEFVHHTQALRGDFETRCWGDLEREAYQAQMAFLKAKGHENPLEYMNLGPLTYAIVTSCGDW